MVRPAQAACMVLVAILLQCSMSASGTAVGPLALHCAPPTAPLEAMGQEANSLDDQAQAYIGAPMIEDLRLLFAFAAGLVAVKVLDRHGAGGAAPPGSDGEIIEVKIFGLSM